MTGPELSDYLYRHRKSLIVVVALVVLGAMGFFGYAKYQRHQMAQAASVYSELTQTVAANETAAAQASAQTLLQKYPHTPYATMARFFMARMEMMQHHDAQAQAQLQTILKSGHLPTGMEGLARFALARLQLGQGQAKSALETLGSPGDAYAPLFWELRGDAREQLKEWPKARQDYRKAEQALPATDPYRAYLQLKLANIGVHS
ncbi:tetratricopeptide repeat protein [Acidithiobacillus sp.]|uniref:YfgM family protein n=1 Tax=Acidithiobacillus sp. TaxID=1872118 RepID=UPI0025BD47EC|nr:tetratricopeptide repeat protein [Acidithiobacillus sp.]